MLRNDLHVDNIVSSLPSEDLLCDYFTICRSIFKDAGFNLRSWASNSHVLRELARSENVQDSVPVTKVLGLHWNSETDTISFPDKSNILEGNTPTTKREVLKQSSSIYDPLGILSPITVRSKMLMQSLWQRGINWDEPLPLYVTVGWNDLRHDLARAADTEIPRCYFTQGAETSNDRILHVFTDSSMKAYGACAYTVSDNESTLVMARTRVATQKHIMIPRLELMAAVIGARFCDHIMRNLECARAYLLSDSQIVLR